MKTLRNSGRVHRSGFGRTSIVQVCVALCFTVVVAAASAQLAPNNQQNLGNVPNGFGPAGNPGNGMLNGPFGGANNNAATGGGANADFETLIDLIVSTVQQESWVDNGGTGDIRQFASGGVFIDTAGTLRLKERRTKDQAGGDLASQRGAAPPMNMQAGDPRRASRLRYVSLPRLEREIARRQAAKEKLDVSMLTLAGLERVQYVFVYPESGDLVLAGPAGDWRLDADGRLVSKSSGRPVVRLDDLLVLLRRALAAGDSSFGCSINPRQEALANTQAFLNQTSSQPLQPGQRKAWLTKLRDTMGKQDIEIFGVDPATRVAGVLVEADYHMKLIGMGLADGVDGVESYLDSIKLRNGEAPPAMSVLRWWFTLNYEAVRTVPGGDAYELVGQGVRVLSENELLAAQGQRVHTGQSEPLNKKFADSFTAHFAALAEKYPIYADLRNVFDLAMAAALIQSDGLAARVKWQPALLTSAEKLRLPARTVPRQVETVINHRVIGGRHVVAGVSGGVMVAANDVLRDGRSTDAAGKLTESRQPAPAAANAPGAWWWDAGE
jgi:hypothetical protein